MTRLSSLTGVLFSLYQSVSLNQRACSYSAGLALGDLVGLIATGCRAQVVASLETISEVVNLFAGELVSGTGQLAALCLFVVSLIAVGPDEAIIQQAKAPWDLIIFSPDGQYTNKGINVFTVFQALVDLELVHPVIGIVSEQLWHPLNCLGQRQALISNPHVFRVAQG